MVNKKECRMKNEIIIFIVSLIIFVASTSLIGFNQEPAKGSSEAPEYNMPGITDVRLLSAVVSCITMICSLILIFVEVKGVEQTLKEN